MKNLTLSKRQPKIDPSGRNHFSPNLAGIEIIANGGRRQIHKKIGGL